MLPAFCQETDSAPEVNSEKQQERHDRRTKLLEMLRSRVASRTSSGRNSNMTGRPKKQERMVNFALCLATGDTDQNGERKVERIKSPH